MAEIADAPSGDLTQNDILEALKDDVLDDAVDDDSDDLDDDKGEEGKVKTLRPDSGKSEGDEDDSEDQGKEKEAEEVEIADDEDDFELVEVPKRKEILKAYPDIFKKFPAIERAIYREDQYTKIFPSIKEAQVASERLGELAAVEKDLLDGNIGGLLKGVKDTDPKAFEKISKGLLTTLYEIEPEAARTIGNFVTKGALSNAFTTAKAAMAEATSEAEKEQAEQLGLAAQILYKYYYNTTKVSAAEDITPAKTEDPKTAEISKREQELNQRELSTAVNSVSSKVAGSIRSAVEKYIDPKEMMTAYVKGVAIKDVVAAVESEITGDSRFRAHLDKLWMASRDAGYSEESTARIRKAIIAKAQAILPGHIKKVRADALKGSNNSSSRRVSKKEDDDQPETRRSAAPRNTSSAPKDKPRRVGGVNDVVRFLGD